MSAVESHVLSPMIHLKTKPDMVWSLMLLAYLHKLKPCYIQAVRGWCIHSSFWSLTFKESLFFTIIYAGKCFAEHACHFSPPPLPQLHWFTFWTFLFWLSSALVLSLIGSSVVQPSAWPRVTRLLPLFPWHLPVPQLSAGLSPCRHVASELSQQGSVCGAARGEGSFSCPIPLVLDNTGPGPQSPLDP